MSNITVTVEEVQPEPSIELVIGQQKMIRAVSDNGATLADLLNAAFVETEQPQRVVTPDPETGEIVLGDRVYIMRNGDVEGRTTNGKDVVQPGDRVVVDRKHTNG